ncbi:epididymal-specific lipocalin-9 [Globicephala melas]|uniref:epididymal-specific lipocalin-9 n=1 Tax=Globicephala melas TaxID=9731 RepID=UPI00293D86D5|nr:uterocalin-like [Globicephala melas]
MSLLLLAVGLTLLGCPQALHWGPQDPNFNETLVSGEWFLAGMASNQPKLLKEDKDAGLLVHRIQVTPRALQLHLHKKVNGACVPITMMANKTKRKFQYRLEDADQNRLFLEKVDPKSYVILCNHREKREKDVVVVNLLSRTPEASPDALLLFTNYCRSHGIHPTNIIKVTATDACPRLPQPRTSAQLATDHCPRA